MVEVSCTRIGCTQDMDSRAWQTVVLFTSSSSSELQSRCLTRQKEDTEVVVTLELIKLNMKDTQPRLERQAAAAAPAGAGRLKPNVENPTGRDKKYCPLSPEGLHICLG